MKYKVCPYCGAHLDFGERCDCNGGALHRDNKLITKRRYKYGQHDVTGRHESGT